MKYEKKKGRYVFEKDGMYFTLTSAQLDDMLETIQEIIKAENPVWVCVVDGDNDPISDCVWDTGNISDCSIAAKGVSKELCQFWKKI